MRTYYLNVLGLGPNATLSEIKKAYRTLARKYHPDVSTLPNAKDKFIAVKEAYTYLISPQKMPPKKQQVWKQPAAPPKTKAKSEVAQRREKMREFLRKKQEMERAEIEALRKMTFQEFLRSAYFRKNAKNIFDVIFSGPGFGALSVVFWMVWFFNKLEMYLPAVLVAIFPIAIILWALFSRPKKT